MGDSIGSFGFWIAIGLINMAFWGAMSPVIKAWADRIRGSVPPPADLEARLAALEAVRPVTGETDLVYQRMAELEERLDFAERLLVKGRDEAARIGGAQ
jgi:hypothetical protein